MQGYLMNEQTSIPDIFCWTKFGVEAAEPIEVILARKEQERFANRGVFLWGIGNAVLPSIVALVKCVNRPEVLFSPILTRPRAVDADPKAVVAWCAGISTTGERWDIPETHLCTSGFGGEALRRPHYALVCSSDRAIRLRPGEKPIFPSTLRNLVSGNSLGASQVTAVVRRDHKATPAGRSYEIAMRANLVSPYCVRLTDPVLVPSGYHGSTRQPDWQSPTQEHPSPFAAQG